MAVLGRLLIGSQQRLDLPDLLSIDSYTASDFRYLIKSFVGDQPLVLKGFEIIDAPQSVGTTSVSIKVADSVLYNSISSAGSFFYGLPEGDPLSQPLVPELRLNAINYVYLTLSSVGKSQDSRSFWDIDLNGGAGGEFNQDVNTQSVLQVDINVSVSTFPEGVIPIAKIKMNSSVITEITDCRNMMFRLGSGGVNPDPTSTYKFRSLPNPTYRRDEPTITIDSSGSPSPFFGGDKNIHNLKEWMDAVMTKLLELSGTTYWYESSPTLSLLNVFSDSLATSIKSKGRWSHDGSTPGKITWSEDIVVRKMNDPRDIIIRSNAIDGETLLDDQVMWIRLVRGVEINDTDTVVNFQNGQAYVNGPAGSFVNLKKGDWIKRYGDDDYLYLRVEEFKDGADGVGSPTTPTEAVSIVLSDAYAGPTISDIAVYTKGEYLNSDIFVTDRDSADSFASGGDFFWLANRSDTIQGIAGIAGVSFSGNVNISDSDGVRAKLTFPSPHGLLDGDRIVVSGAGSYNGTYQIEVDSSTVVVINTTAKTNPTGVTVSWAVVTTAARSTANSYQLESANHNFESNQTIIIDGTSSLYDSYQGGKYQINYRNATSFQIPYDSNTVVGAGGTATCARVNLKTEFGAARVIQGESIDINEPDTVNILKYIGMDSLAQVSPVYQLPTGYNTLSGFQDFNSSPSDNLTTRVSKLTAMMADRVQDRGSKIIGRGVFRNETSGLNQTISVSGSISIEKPGSPQQSISIGSTITLDNMPSGVNGQIVALTRDGYGNIYAGGNFTTAGGTATGQVAKWNGSSWSALGSGVNGTVSCLATDSSGNLYVGGSFTTAGGVSASRIAKWNGITWSALGSGMNDSVLALAVDSFGDVYAGGEFTTAGGVGASRIAKWDGITWSSLGTGAGAAVLALALDASGTLYVGGTFTTVDGISANRIAKWNGSAWTSLGGGTDNSVLALAVDSSGNVYAGGLFTAAGAVSTNRIARWNGTTWSSMSSGANSAVLSLTIDSSGNLYAGGNFTLVGGVGANRIAKWNGSIWSALGGGTNDLVLAITTNSYGSLFIGGDFTTAGGVSASRIAKWDGSKWGSGVNYTVNSITKDTSGNIYVGGEFTNAGGTTVTRIAKWSGTSWSALGSGMNGVVSSLATDFSGNLYAGGQFTIAGGVSVSYIAKWTGTTWTTLGSGVNNFVRTLAVDSFGNIYAGGDFTAAGAISVNYIAKWNGSVWSALGSGLNNYVNSIDVDGAGNVYVGGAFTAAGAIGVNYIAKWDGSVWSSLGSGTSSEISAVAVDSSANVYVGGNFSNAGAVPALRIAKWDGAFWSTLGSGMNATVLTLAIDSFNNVYAGGGFTTAGGTNANRIAKWNGSTWTTLDNGLDNEVRSIIIDDSNNLYVGGFFSQYYSYIAKWNGDIWSDLGDLPSYTGTGFSLGTNQALVGTISRESSTAITTTVESLGSPFLLEENKIILFYRFSGTSVYSWDGHEIRNSSSWTGNDYETSQNKNIIVQDFAGVVYDNTNRVFYYNSSSGNVSIVIPGSLDNTINTSAINSLPPSSRALNNNQSVWIRINRASAKIFNTTTNSAVYQDSNSAGALYITNTSLVPTGQDILVLYSVRNDVLIQHHYFNPSGNIYEEYKMGVPAATNSNEFTAPASINSVIFLPLDSREAESLQYYVVGSGQLQVFLNGQRLRLNDDYFELGDAGSLSTKIQVLQDLVVDDVLLFRIDGNSAVYFISGTGASVTLQNAYDNGNTIEVETGSPVTLSGPIGEKLLIVDGDATVTGVVESKAVNLTPSTSNPLPSASNGLWVDTNGDLHQYRDGELVEDVNITNSILNPSSFLPAGDGLSYLGSTLNVNIDSEGGLEIDSDSLRVKLPVDSGLVSDSTGLKVNVDNSTLEIVSNTISVKRVETLTTSLSNNSGLDIAVQSVVFINSLGNIEVINVSDETKAMAIAGITTEDIVSGNAGAVATSGRLLNITGSFDFGDVLYVDKSGGLTNIAPDIGAGSPAFEVGDFIIKIGVVVKNQANPLNKDLLLQIQVIGQL